MQLLVIRHGLAGDRDEFAFTGRPDSERPLTREGRVKMRRGAMGLRSILADLDLVATSPLVRAVQTAEVVADVFGGMQITTVDQLSPDHAPDDMLPWLRSHDPGTTIAVIGHEPHLGFLVGWLLTGRHESFVELKKGAAVLLEFDDPPSAGGATLLWALPPGHLRKLRKAR
ncbi:MAG TPA: phosphohistidine phosphatase SixA [Longimicrobium sp.]|nr:phosphohistidine phosphatase SixA [Longimicrobium sp.]